MSLLYILLLKLDEYYSKPIKELDEAMWKKMYNVFMNRWSVFVNLDNHVRIVRI